MQTDTVDMVTVDVEILKSVYLEAQEAAKRNGENMATVGRQILRQVLAKPDSSELRNLKPTERPKDAVKRPYRFEMPEDQYEQIKVIIQRHGKSVAGWVEYKLKRLAATGSII